MATLSMGGAEFVYHPLGISQEPLTHRIQRRAADFFGRLVCLVRGRAKITGLASDRLGNALRSARCRVELFAMGLKDTGHGLHPAGCGLGGAVHRQPGFTDARLDFPRCLAHPAFRSVGRRFTGIRQGLGSVADR